MNLYPFELEANLIQIIMLFVMVGWRVIRYYGKRQFVQQLFIYGLISQVLMNIYWVASLLLNKQTGNTIFMASDTASIANFLFWISMFRYGSGLKYWSKASFKAVPIVATVFALWNYIWWNLWTRNYVINTLWIIPLAMLTYLIFYTIDSKNAFSRPAKIKMAGLLSVLLVFETFMYFYPSDSFIYIFSDWTCAAVWLFLILQSAIQAVREREGRTTWLFAAMLFSLYAQFLTDGVRYSFFMVAETIVEVFLIIFFREEDIRKEAER